MRASAACSLLLMLLPLPLPAQEKSAAPSDATLPVTRVTLYTSGVGYFERGGTVDGNAAETLLFPIGQVNDVLKSLVLLDTGGGSIQPVTYAAQDPVGRQLHAFSLDLSDNPDRATLLNRLRGAPVTVSFTADGAAKTLTSVILGVETQTITLPNNGGTTQQSLLNLSSDDGLHSVALSAVTDLKIDDPKLNNEMRQALSVVAQGRDVGKRPVKLNFTGHGRRSVLIGYLTETPLWQTTYRLVLGAHPILQGWALVQNTGQDDWNNVNLTLVSGRPISFIQDLYTPTYIPRPIVQSRVQASPTPQTYSSNLQAESYEMTAAAPTVNDFGRQQGNTTALGARQVQNEERQSAIEGEQARAKFTGDLNTLAEAGKPSSYNAYLGKVSFTTSGETLGTALFTYQIKVPVTVPRQQSAMIPFVASPIQAESVAIYNPQVQASHPLSGARVKNTTGLHLMGGPLTVFDEGGNGNGYVGDALMDDTEPNQSRLLSYALDLAVDADKKPGEGSGEMVSILISHGVLTATQKNQESTVYTFKNNSAKPRTLVVEQPYRGEDWRLLAPKAATERTADSYRFDVPVAAGKSVTFTVREEHPEVHEFVLLNAASEDIVSYAKSGVASEAVKTALQEVLARRRRIAETQAKITIIGNSIDTIGQGQERIRDNMKALDRTSALYKRYVAELDAQETKLNGLQIQKDALQSELAGEQNDLNHYLSHLTLS